MSKTRTLIGQNVKDTNPDWSKCQRFEPSLVKAIDLYSDLHAYMYVRVMGLQNTIILQNKTKTKKQNGNGNIKQE